MPNANADRNLLFGVLALQADLITSDRFAEACSAWAARKETPLADLLVERGWLTAGDKADVEKLLERKLKKHGGNERASLLEVTTDSVRHSLAGLDDPELARSLTPPPAGHVLLATTDYQPEARERYTLSRLHATGGIGRVWLARDVSLGRDVALKELRPERASQPALWGRFFKEAQITGQLEHPGIVPVYELGKRPGDAQPFYTMRFVRGRTLAEAATAYHQRPPADTAKPLALRELLTAFVGVCNAVAYAHSRGVLHRDLKPQNVVLGDFGEVIVLDWGLAKVIDQKEEALAAPTVAKDDDEQATIQGQILGTPAYLAPEQAEGRLDLLDARTDVYGLGAILYEILTGQPPFCAADTTMLLRRILHEAPAPPRSVVPATSPALEAVCLKALAKRPADRYAGAKALAADVQHWLADEPAAAYREPWTARTRRWVRRHRTLATSGVVALAVGTVLLSLAALLLAAKNGQLALANDELTQANARERVAKEQAESNFAMAQAAVEKYLNAVTADADLKKADFNKLRKKLMETAVPFYEKFVELQRDDPSLEAARGKAYQRLAGLRYALGEQRLSRADAERARDVFARLVASFPDRADYRYEYAISHGNVARNLAAGGALAPAAEAMAQATREYEKLAKAFPDKPVYRSEQGNSQNNEGVLLQQLGRYADAEIAYRKALALRERLVDEFPKETAYRQGLGRTMNSLGHMAGELQKLEESERNYRRSLHLFEKNVADRPEDQEYLSDLAMSCSNLGSALQYLRNYGEAAEMFQKAIAVRGKLADHFPTIVFHRQLLGTAYFNLAENLQFVGRLAEAEAAYRQSLALQRKLIADAPNVSEYRLDLGRTLATLASLLSTLGRYADAARPLREAVAELEKVTAESPDAAAWLVVLAEAYAYGGRLDRFRGEHEAAVRWYAKAIETLERCRQKRSDLGEARTSLRSAVAGRAAVLDQLGRRADALKDWDRVLELADAADTGYYRCRRQLSAGQLAEAVAGAEALAQTKEVRSETLYSLAGIVSLASARVKSDAGVKDRYAAAAVRLLRLASKRGYVPAAQLKTDPELTGLRAREDFQKLQAELAAKSTDKRAQ